MKVKGHLQVSSITSTGQVKGITFTDGSVTYSNQPKLTFDSGGFYIGGDGTGGPRVQLKTPGITVKDGGKTFSAFSIIGLNSDHFYATPMADGAPVFNLKRDPIVRRTTTIEFPGSAENVLMFFTSKALTIYSAIAVLVGSASPSVTFSVQSGTSRASLGVTHTSSEAVTDTTTGRILTVSTAAIPANSWVAIVTTAQSGTVNSMSVSMELLEN